MDTPAFLHFGWFVQQSLEGNPGGGLVDNYWYGGLELFATYPPLSYGAVGVLGYVTKASVFTAYTAILLMAYIGTGMSVYWLSRELGLTRFGGAVAALLTVLAYPILAAIGLWGWFTTLVALPFAIGSLALLERAIRRESWRLGALAGALFALSLLSHHMTAFAFAPVVAIRLLFWLWDDFGHYRTLVRGVGAFGVAAAAVSLWWVIPFIFHVAEVDFRREVAGLWSFSWVEYMRSLTRTDLIGAFTYPSYVGWVYIALGTAGVVLALVQRSRVTPLALGTLVLIAFSLGERINPLVRVYPFAALDVARFAVYFTPLISVLAAFVLTSVLDALMPGLARLAEKWKGSPLPSWRVRAAALSIVTAAVLALPVRDAIHSSSEVLQPFEVTPQVQQSLDWLREQPPGGSVLGIGWWNWDTFLIPYDSNRAVVDGWYDEGVVDWRPIREIRHMMWFAAPDIPRLYETLSARDGRYVVVAPDAPLEFPDTFLAALREHPHLFRQVASWGDVVAFERVDRRVAVQP